MSSYEQLIADACNVLEQHNATPGVSLIDIPAFQKGLKEIGGTSIKALREISTKDLEERGIPRLTAKQLTRLLRERCEEKLSSSKKIRKKGITEKNRSYATVEELVADFDPRHPMTPAAQEIKLRSEGHPCIVFDEQGGIHRKATVTALNDLINGEPVREHVLVSDRPHKLYRIGERPPEMADEHPLRRGTALHSNGTDELGLNWLGENLTLEVRILLHLAVHETRELVVNGNDDIHGAHTLASSEESAQKLRMRYPKASGRYDELAQQGALPRLKVQKRGTKTTSSGSGNNDPFLNSAHKRF